MGWTGPTRLWIAVMMFTATLMNYMMRVNMSVNIIAMVPPPKARSSAAALTENKSLSNSSNIIVSPPQLRQKTNPNDELFDWTPKEQAHVLGGYFWGYAISSFFGGTMAERWGPRLLILIVMVIVSILTALSAPAARIHFIALVFARFGNGFASGLLFPALHALVARWAPPHEKGKFISSLLGGSIGTVITWSCTGDIIGWWGWAVAFYIPGVLGLLWCVWWMYVVYNNPVEHPRISEAERQYIVDALGSKVKHSTEKKVPPFKQIMTSSPFIAHIMLHFGSDWGLYLIMTAAPLYMKNSLGFNLRNAGALSSLPYLGRIGFAFLFGIIGDKIIKAKIAPLTVIRKCFTLFSHILPGIILIFLGYTSVPMLCVFLITLSLAFNGAAALTNLVNHQDLSPNYAGTLYGIANGFGNCSGFICPLITAHFTWDGNSQAHWRPVFIVGAMCYIGSAIYFIIFGSAKTQKWNYYSSGGAPPEESKETK